MGALPIGIGGFVVLLLLSLFTGVDFLSLVGTDGTAPSGSTATTGTVATSPEEEALVDLVDSVVADSETTWEHLLGGRYQPTRAVLFRDAIQSACGFAQSATGPFYCPGDAKVYLDLGFFDDLRRQFGAPGHFAQAYVVAHEVGHHVQNVLGIEQRVRQQQAARPDQVNELSVRLELQADCFAGIWGNAAAANGANARVSLDPGDVDDGLRAAAAIGDDRLQRLGGGRVMPERFTHGTSDQRASWLRRGLESGDPSACDTFAAR
jgi:predicted metalloprotease